MHTLSIHFGPSQLVWMLCFKEAKDADVAETKIMSFMSSQHLTQQIADNRMLTVTDDFGQRAHLVAGQIHGVLVEDADYSQEAMIQRHLHSQRTQVKAQQRAGNDPVLKAAGLSRGMPAFDPMQNGRFS